MQRGGMENSGVATKKIKTSVSTETGRQHKSSGGQIVVENGTVDKIKSDIDEYE